MLQVKLSQISASPESLSSETMLPSRPEDYSLVRRWVAANLLAEAFALAIAAWVIKTHAIEPGSAQLGALAYCGLGAIEGAALGILQSSVLRRRLTQLRRFEWVAVTLLVAASSWWVMALGRSWVAEHALRFGQRPSSYMLLVLTLGLGAIGGAVFGAAQAVVLRRYARDASRWPLANALARACATPIVFFGAQLVEPSGQTAATAIAALFIGLFAGGVSGSVSSVFVQQLVPWVDEAWSLRGQVCAVTGAQRGLGLAIATGLARLGARVIVLGRDASAGQAALRAIQRAVPNAELDWIQLDLGSLASVEKAAQEILTRFPRLDVLVNNAGAVFRARKVTADGLEATLAVDAIGPFLLTSLLLDRLEASNGRVVNLAGIYQRRGAIVFDDLHFERRSYRWSEANAQAQLARVLLSAELARRSPAVFTASVHPGAVWTSLPAEFAGSAIARLRVLFRPLFLGVELGAQPIVRLAAEPVPLMAASGSFFDRFALTSDRVDAALAARFWNKCRELVGAHAAGSPRLAGDATQPSSPG
jgi:NAD(P)-dependent dehydrogenase (short-subunit alcohol dehydrogenase family)